MNSFSIACPAKVNLFLRIVAREDSGYHQIETLFQAVGLYDRIDAHPAGDGIDFEAHPAETGTGLGDITAEIGDPEVNSVVRAARSFYEAARIEPAVRLVLTKAIPAGTGLGGASSDAAGTLAVLNALHGEPLRHHQIIRLGAWIGSDVPFFCTGLTTALGWGRGERLLERRLPPAAQVVVVVPEARMSTSTAYREVSARLKLPVPPRWLRDIETGDWEGLADLQENDFELIAFEQMPALQGVREALDEAGAVTAGLTGSGLALFGVFDDGERAADAARVAGAMEGVAGALVVPTLSEMPTVQRIDSDM
ncbi:MAG: 4-(cytidine 5'-diphospho)-2-C-methyl-D-erythritol kinase [Gemmatimonadetes bacterium]|nr:4-(cytidine 5'-diphospho)-2-C-methyl-D-erythritol kinase [Gemmatimonadota bacterium]MYB99605.1 4-(cytidine 5'-diphospho)-2-C-methyl-D-erythritol kinase [Gemmatimonadota bacterium]MYI46818.1 4-(cytidine 5'-diphospho)-2-C-methyl-D-erythritol kinase [Gemmatimonadota bacterium]